MSGQLGIATMKRNYEKYAKSGKVTGLSGAPDSFQKKQRFAGAEKESGWGSCNNGYRRTVQGAE